MTPDELADLEDSLNGLDGDGEDLDDEDDEEDVHEYEKWMALGQQFRELSHELRQPLMGLRRHMTSGPPGSHWPDALAASGRVVAQTQGIVSEIDRHADYAERRAWDCYHGYLADELKSL